MCPKRAECGEIRPFGVKFGLFWGENVKVIQKRDANFRVSVVDYVLNLHSTHPLRCASRLSFALAGSLFEFHLAETEGQADGNAAAVVSVIGRGLHIRAVVGLPEAVPIEDVIGIDEH